MLEKIKNIFIFQHEVLRQVGNFHPPRPISGYSHLFIVIRKKRNMVQLKFKKSLRIAHSVREASDEASRPTPVLCEALSSNRGGRC